MALPQRIAISEVGPRDGLQIEQAFLPTAHRIALMRTSPPIFFPSLVA
jgi:hypothetical protein